MTHGFTHSNYLKRLIAVLGMGCIPYIWNTSIYAQAFATESGEMQATPTASVIKESTPSGILNTPPASPSAASIITEYTTGVSTPSATPTIPLVAPDVLLGPSGVLSQSATTKQLPHIRLMNKKTFRAGEIASVIVEDADIKDIRATVRDSKGMVVESTPSLALYDGGVRVLFVPKTALNPGKYTMVIEDVTTGTILTQDFLWGVLAFNTDQSVYFPGDTANIAVAVLDEQGMMVCNADVTVSIVSPTGIKTVHTTSGGEIRVTPECSLHGFTLKPDYEMTFQTSDEGIYAVTLTAKTANGTYTIHDTFQVSSDVPFQVRRTSATRIFPPEVYPMTITVTAHEDFSGSITETVPEHFTISPLDGSLTYTEVKIVAPEMDLQSSTPISLSMPFEGNYPVTLGFGERVKDPQLKSQYEQFGLKGHDGADFAMPEGTQIIAVDSGKVSRIADDPYGTTLVVDHVWGRSYYGHLSTVLVNVGDEISKGTAVALSGKTGLTTGSHLHFGMKFTDNNMENGYYGKIDPMPYLTSSAMYLSDSSVKQITWHLTLKKGETMQLGYTYKTPSTSPQFYLIGPLTFHTQRRATPASNVSSNPFALGMATESATLLEASASGEATQSGTVLGVMLKSETTQQMFENEVMYQESRQWQLAIDASAILYANADVYTTNWTTGTCTSNLWGCIDEGTASYNDSDYIGTKKATDTYYTHTCTASPSDTDTVTAIAFTFRAYKGGSNAVDITVFYSTDGSDPSIQVGAAQTMTTSVAPYTVNATGLSLTKTQIDALRVKYVVNNSTNTFAYITAAQYDLTYTPVVTGPTTDQQMRHGNWFNAGVEQGFTF